MISVSESVAGGWISPRSGQGNHGVPPALRVGSAPDEASLSASSVKIREAKRHLENQSPWELEMNAISIEIFWDMSQRSPQREDIQGFLKAWTVQLRQADVGHNHRRLESLRDHPTERGERRVSPLQGSPNCSLGSFVPFCFLPDSH